MDVLGVYNKIVRYSRQCVVIIENIRHVKGLKIQTVASRKPNCLPHGRESRTHISMCVF